MSRENRRLLDYLSDILKAIGRIEHYAAGMSEGTFLTSPLVQDAVIRNFEIIGEASRNIKTNFPEFAVAYPDIPLTFAYQMRNALAHGYFEVDLEIVWRTIHRDLPGLRAQLQNALESLSG